MKTKSWIIAIMAAFLIVPAASCPVLSMNLLEPETISFDAGILDQDEDRDELYFLSAHPAFRVGSRVSFVLDLNFFVNNEFKMRDGGNDSVVLGSLRYNDADRFILNYGEIENLTFGSGFIVSNYRTNARGNVPLNRQKAIDIELNSGRSQIKAFGTRTSLVGVRAVRSLGTLTVGTTLVSDSDPDFQVYGIDGLYTFFPEKLSMYAEIAKITDYGDGYAIGALFTPTRFVDLKMEFREYDSDFLPGVIDEHYEAKSYILSDALNSSDGRLWGFYSALDLFRGADFSGTVIYEDYESYEPRVTLQGSARFRRLRGDVFFAKQNFVASDGDSGEDSVVRIRGTYSYKPELDFFFDFYNAYADDNSPLESFKIGAKYHLW